MRLVIETYLRATDDSSGYLALAVPEGHQLGEAGVCGDESERRAIIGAVHSYFNRQERPVAVTVDKWIVQSDDHPVVDRPATAATDQSTIERVLREAIARRTADATIELADGTAPQFYMTYVDQGGVQTVRTIIPSRLERRGRESGFPETYLIAYDTAKDEPRTFRVDRIERLEAL